MTYKETLGFLDSRIALGWKLGLESMNRMLKELGDPQQRLRFVHVAGTNGKGSVSAMLESVCRTVGLRTGLYTSPHLVDVRERIRVNGRLISKKALAEVIDRIRPTVERYGATYFETLTAAALVYFERQAVDIVCLEVGLGGRLDATNVVKPLVSVITSISLDHTEHLGPTPAAIAAEKAGIIKERVPCVIGELPREAEEVIKRVCLEKDAPLLRAGEHYRAEVVRMRLGAMTVALNGKGFSGAVRMRLTGRQQAHNLEIAATVCDVLGEVGLPISVDAFRRGMAACRWPGRLEVLHCRPLVVADAAHNPASMEKLKETVQSLFPGRRLLLIIGLLRDKDAYEVARQAIQFADLVMPVTPPSERALPAESLGAIFEELGRRTAEPASTAAALRELMSRADDKTVIIVTGSHYIVGEAVAEIKGLTK